MIEVTQHHITRALDQIARGIPREEYFPVALALRENGDDRAKVMDGAITWYGVDLNVPSDVTEFVNDFDAGKPVLPFSFELDEENAF